MRVHNFSVSLDGFGTAEGQSLMPRSGTGVRLHEWFFATRTFHAMQGQPGGSTGIDDAFASAREPGIGARDPMGGQVRPPPRPLAEPGVERMVGRQPAVPHPGLCILTHHPRPSVQMNGGTTSHFLVSPAQALAQARQAAACGYPHRRRPAPPRSAVHLIDYLHIASWCPSCWARGAAGDGLEALEDHFQIEAVNSPQRRHHLTSGRR